MATKFFLKDAAPSTLTLGSGTRACDLTAGSAQTTSDATPTVGPPTSPAFRDAGHGNANNAATCVVTKPAGVVSGDVLLAWASFGAANSETLTLPSGWALVADCPSTGVSGGTNGRFWLAYKVAGPSETSSYTFTVTTVSGTHHWQVMIAAYSGCDQSNPINVEDTAIGASTNSVVTASVTPTKDNTRIVAFFGEDGAGTTTDSWTTPSGYTLRDTYQEPNSFIFAGAFDKAQTTAAAVTATSTKNANDATNNARESGTAIVALNPVSTTVAITKGGAALTWTSPPVNAFTLAGSFTINIWALESNALANTQLVVAVNIYSGAGAWLAQPYFGVIGTELPTTVAAQNWAITPTNTAVPQGAIIQVNVMFNPIGTMAVGYTVTASYNGGTGGANGDSWVQFTEAVTLASGAAPVNSGAAPSISGSAGVGNVLTGSVGGWSGATSTTWRFKNELNATLSANTTYTQQAADVGHTIYFEVTATNATGSTIVTSAGVAVPAVFQVNTAPVLSGTASVGSVLTVTPGTYNGGTPTIVRKLIRSTDNGATYVEISTLTGLTYTLTADDDPNPTTLVKVREYATL